MEKRYFIKVGNCYVSFLWSWHEVRMRSDFHKAEPFLTREDAVREAKLRGLKEFKIVEKEI